MLLMLQVAAVTILFACKRMWQETKANCTAALMGVLSCAAACQTPWPAKCEDLRANALLHLHHTYCLCHCSVSAMLVALEYTHVDLDFATIADFGCCSRAGQTNCTTSDIRWSFQPRCCSAQHRCIHQCSICTEQVPGGKPASYRQCVCINCWDERL